MSDVTTAEGITVVGQRRVASGLGFPIRPSGGLADCWAERSPDW